MSDLWTGMGGNIVYSIFYLNTILTPDQPEYKRYYFEEREYGYIGPSFGSSVVLQLAEYNVTTDQSIWPYAD
jgi:hypothetical protein